MTLAFHRGLHIPLLLEHPAALTQTTLVAFLRLIQPQLKPMVALHPLALILVGTAAQL
jgi:hypothetical protein